MHLLKLRRLVSTWPPLAPGPQCFLSSLPKLPVKVVRMRRMISTRQQATERRATQPLHSCRRLMTLSLAKYVLFVLLLSFSHSLPLLKKSALFSVHSTRLLAVWQYTKNERGHVCLRDDLIRALLGVLYCLH